MGNIMHFCRPMPKETCEQAYPGINYLPRRRDDEGKQNNYNNKESNTNRLEKIRKLIINYPTNIIDVKFSVFICLLLINAKTT